jgi:hypothetical protein
VTFGKNTSSGTQAEREGHLELGVDGLRLAAMTGSLEERMGPGRWEGAPGVEKDTHFVG